MYICKCILLTALRVDYINKFIFQPEPQWEVNWIREPRTRCREYMQIQWLNKVQILLIIILNNLLL